MSYRNKTYVAFASEDIHLYRLMQAWHKNEGIDFDFFDAHDLNTARDTSTDETIRRRLRERLMNTKQVVLLGSPAAKKKGGDVTSFLGYEVKKIIELGVPVVVANIDGSRTVNHSNYPAPLKDADTYTMSVSFQPTIIAHALDKYVPIFQSNTDKTGPYYYKASVYEQLGL